MPDILLALDCSPHSRRAVEYVARIAPHLPECRVTLLVVSTGIPYSAQAEGKDKTEPELHGDEDHRQERKEVDAFLDNMEKILVDSGIAPEFLQKRVKPLARGVAHDILDEAVATDSDTLVVGRRGVSKVRALFIGSISSELIKLAEGRTVWVVE